MVDTGTDTGWLTEVAGLTPIKVGDKFGIHVGRPIVIEQIISDTELLLADDWPGPAQTDAPYKVELTPPTIAAVEAMRRLLASLSNGNLDSLSEITVGVDDIPVGLGPGVFGTVKKSALVNGVEFDVQVDTLADRAAYNAQAEGFKVLVSDVGDGRAALYSKNSATSGDWSDPSYITGGKEDQGDPGPAGVTPVGNYNSGSTYAERDAVLNNGSTWIAKSAVPTGQAPPTLPTTENTYWRLLAAKGADGSGTGDVVGPAGGVAAGDYAVFLDTTGKVIGKTTNPPGGQNDAILALEIADLKGSRLGMKGGVADAFDDETGVDVKTNAVYDAANDWYVPSSVPGADQIPTMTAATTSGVTMSDNGNSGSGFEAWRAGDKNTSGGFSQNPFVTNNFIKVDFGPGNSKVIANYSLHCNTVNYPTSFKLQGSNDNSAWTDLDSRTSQVWSVAGYRSFTVSTPASYRYYRVLFIAISGSALSVNEITLNIAVIYNNMTLRSIAYAATSVPTTGRLAVQLVETDAITINTDLIARISRDGGATWATAALSLTQSLIGPKMYEANGISLASLGSGTSMKWEIATANNENVAVSGVVAQWS